MYILEQTLRDQITADIPTEEIHVYMREIFVAFFPEDPYYTKPEVSNKQRQSPSPGPKPCLTPCIRGSLLRAW